MIKFKSQGQFRDSEIFRIQFHTAFIQNGNYIRAGRSQVSPESLQKESDKTLPEDFKMHIQFADFCENCDSQVTLISELCPLCTARIGEKQIKEWNDSMRITDVFKPNFNDETRIGNRPWSELKKEVMDNDKYKRKSWFVSASAV